MKTFVKDPSENLDYERDWSRTLQSGSTIESSVWAVPAGLEHDEELDSFTDKTTKLWLRGGEAGTTYTITNTITTSQGRIYERSFLLKIKDL
jgi:hypothetical protein